MNNDNFSNYMKYFAHTRQSQSSIGLRKTLDVMNDFFRQMNKILQAFLNDKEGRGVRSGNNIYDLIPRQVIVNIETLIITRILLKSFILKLISNLKKSSKSYSGQRRIEKLNQN